MNSQTPVRSGKRIETISIVPLRELHPKRFQRAMAKRKKPGFVDRFPAKPKTYAKFELHWQRLASATCSWTTLVDLIFVLANSTARTEVKFTESHTLTASPFDIRVYLSDRQIVGDYFRQLAPFQLKAADEFFMRGDRKTASFLKRIDLNEWVPDFSLWNRCGIEVEMKSVELSQEFVEFALPFVSGNSKSFQDIEKLAATMKQVAESPDHDMKIPLALHVIANAPPAAATAWISVLQALRREDAHPFICSLFGNKAQDALAGIPFLESAFEDVRRTAETSAHGSLIDVQKQGWVAIFNALKTNVDEELIYWGLRIWRLTKRLPQLHKFQGKFPEETMNHWLNWIQDAYRSEGYGMAGQLFDHLGQMPELVKYLELIPADLPVPKKKGLLSFLVREINSREMMRIINEQRFERICEFHRTTNVYQLSCDYFDIVTEKLATRDAFEGALAITERHLKFGQAMSCDDDRFWSDFIVALDKAGKPVAETIQALPDSTFKRLASAFRSNIQSSKIRRGHEKFVRRFAADCSFFLHHFPARYLAVVAKLGDATSLEKSILDSYEFHPLCGEPVWEMDFQELKILTDAIVFHHGLRNPFSKRLRAHLTGERLLEPKILERERKVLEAEIIALRLEILRLEVDRFIHKEDTSAVQSHTIILAKDISDNRRTLRRFINMASSGNDVKAWLKNHPKNQFWMNEMNEAGVDIEKWLQGILIEADIPKLGPVTLTKEEDPEEILKMGTYVGSCLSVGEFNSFSTVANMCDANKQVIYARNKRGKVVGRQLVAISKERELVCFNIYRNHESEKLKDQFLEFDRKLAEEVGLPVFDLSTRGYNGYEIDRLVCQKWYDDGPIRV